MRTLEQKIAHIVIRWIAPRLKREGKSWAECPLTREQVRRLAQLLH